MTVTVIDLRARVETDFDEPTLQRILDSAIKAVDRAAGGIGEQVEVKLPSSSEWLALNRRHTAIVSIGERRRHASDQVMLSANDYRVVGDYRILRLTGGDNSNFCWGNEVEITYTPEVDVAVRDRVALDLSQVDIEFRAYDREKSGDDWMGEQKDWKARRRELLTQVREGRSPFA